MRRGIFQRDDWYTHLASSNLRIAEARERIENQKAHICTLKGHSAGRAIALLMLLEKTLELMKVNRANILEKVRTYRLPVCVQHGLRCETQAKCDSLATRQFAMEAKFRSPQ